MTASSAQKPPFSRTKVQGLKATASSARPGLSWRTKAPVSVSPVPQAISLAQPEPHCVSHARTEPSLQIPGRLSARRVLRAHSCQKLGRSASKSASRAAKDTSPTQRGRLSVGPDLAGLTVQVQSPRNAPHAPRGPMGLRRDCITGRSVHCAPGALPLRSTAPCHQGLSTSSTARGSREPVSAMSALQEPSPTRQGSPAVPLAQPEHLACSLAPSARSSASIATRDILPTRRACKAAFPARRGAT